VDAGRCATKAREGIPHKGLAEKPPTRSEFTAFDQANIEMARSVFRALRTCEARLFASVVSRTIEKPTGSAAEEARTTCSVGGILLSPESRARLRTPDFRGRRQANDQNLVRQIERYFTRTQQVDADHPGSCLCLCSRHLI
jgi:hypothetical protein